MRTIWKLATRARADGCTGLAAMIAYNFFLVLPAFLIFMVSVLSLFPFQDLGGNITSQLRDVLPADAVSLIRRLIDQTLDRAEGQFFILATSLFGTLFVMNSGYAGLISSLNRVFRLEETRPWLRVRLRALIMSLIAAALILATFSLVIVTPSLLEKLSGYEGLLTALSTGLGLARWPVIIGLALLGMETTYKYAPCCGPRWRILSPGTLFATGGWVCATLGFGFYVNNFASYDQVYGALGAVIVILTWMWISALIFLVGAEVNVMWRDWQEARSARKRSLERQPQLDLDV